MGRWAGLSSLIEFESTRGHPHGIPTLTLSTRYTKLDDSIFVLCRNCGHSLKSEEIKKMAAHAGKSRTSPKHHFLTWSAANSRIQKMSKNIVNNVSKLQTKMEKALPFNHHLTAHQEHQQQQENSIVDDSEDGFYPASLSTTTMTTVGRRGTVIKDDSCDVDCFSPINDGLTLNSLSQSPTSHFDSGISKRTRFSFKNTPTGIKSPGCGGGGGTVDKQCVNLSTQNNILNNNNNNGILLNNNFLCDNSHSVEKSNGIIGGGRKSSSLVKSLDLEMRPFTYGGSIDESRMKNESRSSRESCRSANNSSSSISTATTIPITQWSRASSISIGSTTQQCDSQQSRSPTSNNNNNNNNNDNHHHKNNISDEIGTTPSSLFTSSSLSSPLKNSSTIITSTCSSSSSSSSSSTKDEILKNSSTSTSSSSSSSPLATSTLPLPSKLTVTTFEEEELKNASWFQFGIPREIALEVLRNEPIGSFIVRGSTTKTGCFALSLRVPRDFQPTGIVHYLILRTGRGYKIKGFLPTKEFGSLTSLITHHSVMPELLPCPLSLHRYRPKHAQRVNRIASDFVEPEKLITFNNNNNNNNRKFTDF